MWRCDTLKHLKSGGAPASSREGFTARPAREDAGAPFSEETHNEQATNFHHSHQLALHFVRRRWVYCHPVHCFSS
jgi:hypothetical protein